MKITYNKIIFLMFSLFLIIGCKEKISQDILPLITTEVINEEPTEEVEEEIIEDNIKTVRLCHDTDKGIIKWVKGSIFGYYDNATRFEFIDYCQNKNYLMEFYCEEENPLQKLFLCKNGCVDDHCA